MHKAMNIPDLEPRFLEPTGFRIGTFTRKQGRTIRYGCAFPQQGKAPDAVVILLPGLSEFIEKYFETMHDLLDQNIAVWTIDWMGQGGSGRYLKNLDKRHSGDFQDDLDDLHYLITEYVKPSAVHTDVGRIPLAILGHSMGAHLGLRYLAQHTDMIECAGFSAPLAGISAVQHIPQPLLSALENAVSTFVPEWYATPARDWTTHHRPAPCFSPFSNDPRRNPVHMAWMVANPFLRVGGMTYQWVHEALKSCRSLQKEFQKIATPCLIAIAGREMIVDNASIERLVVTNSHMQMIEIPGSQHEILMESDATRAIFLNGFYKLLDDHILSKPETLKPF